MNEIKKRSPHLGLKKLRTLCGKTSDEFARLTGVSYALLVAVEQGRRSLSEQDALLISSATGCDPEFNMKVNGGMLKEISGQPYTEESFRKWVDVDLKALRDLFDETKRKGDPDVFEAILTDNLASLMDAARLQGKDLALTNYISWALGDIADRFGLRPALPFWVNWGVTYGDPVKDPNGGETQKISVKKGIIKFRNHDITHRTKFDPDDPNLKKIKSKTKA